MSSPLCPLQHRSGFFRDDPALLMNAIVLFADVRLMMKSVVVFVVAFLIFLGFFLLFRRFW